MLKRRSYARRTSTRSIERLFARIFPLVGIEPPAVFPRLAYAEAMERFGSDRPDTRFGLEFVELRDQCEGCGFQVLEKAAAEGRVKGLVLPGGAEPLPKAARRSVGARQDPLAFPASCGSRRPRTALRRRPRKCSATTASFGFLEAAGAGPEDLLLVVGRHGRARSLPPWALFDAACSEHDLVPAGRHDFLWVTDFPLLEWDEGEGRFFAMHHPFTSPLVEDFALMDSDPGAVPGEGLRCGHGRCRARRRVDQDPRSRKFSKKMFTALGIEEAEAQDRFGFLLEAFRYGVPPHGGIALGLDRMVMLMARPPIDKGRDRISEDHLRHLSDDEGAVGGRQPPTFGSRAQERLRIPGRRFHSQPRASDTIP